ncbi:hypothetical protein [Vibrio maritimus]|uniref:hypothetical protein n=1 Tax=Vibrio maritimus TaxID=990268 RepID=UPI003735252C
MRLRTLGYAACVLGITGCAQPLPSILDVNVNKLSEEEAVLIVSAGAEETCTSFSSAFVIKESIKQASLSESIGVYQLNNSFLESDFEGEYAKVYSTVMKPGKYDLWIYSQNPFFEFEEPTFTQPFEIKGGEVTYIGEINSDGCNSMYITVKDRRERDLNHIRTYTPSLNINKVVYKPAMIRQQ